MILLLADASSRRSLPPGLGRVEHTMLGGCDRSEMEGVHTVRLSALVMDVVAGRDRAVSHLVRRTMGGDVGVEAVALRTLRPLPDEAGRGVAPRLGHRGRHNDSVSLGELSSHLMRQAPTRLSVAAAKAVTADSCQTTAVTAT
jgi:hypothetical protein